MVEMKRMVTATNEKRLCRRIGQGEIRSWRNAARGLWELNTGLGLQRLNMIGF